MAYYVSNWKSFKGRFFSSYKSTVTIAQQKLSKFTEINKRQEFILPLNNQIWNDNFQTNICVKILIECEIIILSLLFIGMLFAEKKMNGFHGKAFTCWLCADELWNLRKYLRSTDVTCAHIVCMHLCNGIKYHHQISSTN